MTGLPWRATQSEADEASGVRPGFAAVVQLVIITPGLLWPCLALAERRRS